MSPVKYSMIFLKKMYNKNMSMRRIIFFTIVIVTGSTMFGENNCCEQCCEYLEICCKKEGEGEGKNVKNVNNVEENKWKKKEEEVENVNNVEEKEEEEEEEEKEEEEKEKVQKVFYLKKTEAAKPVKNKKKKIETAEPGKIKKLVNTDWYEAKKETASFFLYEKIDNIENGGLNDNNVIKVTKYKNRFRINKNFITKNDNNEKKWALFEIIYEKKGEEKEKKEEETKYLYCSDIENRENNGIFNSCEQHVSISVIACDTSNVTNMASMFSDCSSLRQLDLTNFNTETVTDMGSMFGSCKDLTKIIFGDKFNTAKVKSMGGMFSDCSSLTELDLSKFNTDIITNMGGMFYKCSSLKKLNLSNFNTKNVTDMDYMFISCNSLQTVTFNEILNEEIKNLLNELGFTEKIKEEGNKITLKKNN